MKEPSHSTAVAAALPEEKKELVTIEVDYNHPLLQLKRGLPMEEIEAVMVKHWRAAGKNVDGGPGQKLDVSLYVMLIVLMIVKHYNSREMEEYLAENVVARVFISRQGETKAQIRDHSNIARIMDGLGAEGQEEINAIVVKRATKLGFADPEILSPDTTAQEVPIGYPNEPGILRGIAQRCLRAFGKLKKAGTRVKTEVVEKAKTVLKLVKQHHLFAKTKEEKKKLLNKIITETKRLMKTSKEIAASIGPRAKPVKQAAAQRLTEMVEVTKQLIPQIKYWMKTGKVATGKILHAGITQARAIVRNKTGKRVEFGFKYLINRIGGGYLFGMMLLPSQHETKMPLVALSAYRKIFGEKATPRLFVYDRGGYAEKTVEKLALEGVEKIGVQPKGKAPWLITEPDRQTVRSERGKTEGSIGTLKSQKYGFNLPKERNQETIQAAGHRSILSLNLNSFMKDVSNQKRSGRAKAA
jgi:hypothetical protein